MIQSASAGSGQGEGFGLEAEDISREHACGLADDQLRGVPVQIAILHQCLRVEVQDEVEVPVVHVLDAKRAVGLVIEGPEGLAWSK